jgi:hypothetical protein
MTTFYVRNQEPEENDTYVRIDSLINLGIDVSTGSIDLTKTVISFEYDEEIKTVYSGSTFQTGFRGSNSLVSVSGSGSAYDFTIHPETSFSTSEDIFVHIETRNNLGTNYNYSYSFKTHYLSDKITPITPVFGEKLVTDTTNIIIDFLEEPTLITVRQGIGLPVTVYDGAFQNGWSGEYLSGSNDARIYLDPPSNFTLTEVVYVVVETENDELSYLFYVDTRQITTTNDAWSPRITTAGIKKWEGHVKGILSGSVYLQKINPDTGEQEVALAEIFDHGYDPDLDKYILLYVHSGNVYYSLADPSDTPSRLLDPALQSETGQWSPRLTNNKKKLNPSSGENKDPGINSYPPTKIVKTETISIEKFGCGIEFGVEKFTATLSTHVRTVPLESLLQVEMVATEESPEAEMTTGFELYKVTEGTPNLITTLYLEEGEISIRYNDCSLLSVLNGIELVNVFYYAIPLYNIEGKIFRGEKSSNAEIPKFGSVANIQIKGSGENRDPGITSYIPLKNTYLEDNYIEKVGSGRRGSLLIDGVEYL